MRFSSPCASPWFCAERFSGLIWDGARRGSITSIGASAARSLTERRHWTRPDTGSTVDAAKLTMLGEMTPVERGRSRLCLAPHPPTYQPSKAATSNHPPCSHATPLVGRCRTEIPVPIPMPRAAFQLLGLDRSVYPSELVPGRRGFAYQVDASHILEERLHWIDWCYVQSKRQGPETDKIDENDEAEFLGASCQLGEPGRANVHRLLRCKKGSMKASVPLVRLRKCVPTYRRRLGPAVCTAGIPGRCLGTAAVGR